MDNNDTYDYGLDRYMAEREHEENIWDAIEINPMDIQFVEYPEEDLQLFAMRLDPTVYPYIQYPTKSATKLYKEYCEELDNWLDSLGRD